MTQRLLAGRTPPTAILASSIVTAFGVRRALDTAGLRIGRDVSVITHDDDLSYLRNDGPIPIFTAIRSSVRRAGQLCAERLIQRVQSPTSRWADICWRLNSSWANRPDRRPAPNRSGHYRVRAEDASVQPQKLSGPAHTVC